MKVTQEMIDAAYSVMIDRYAKGADSSEASTKATLRAAIYAAVNVGDDEDFARAGRLLDDAAERASKANGGVQAPIGTAIEIARASTALGLARQGIDVMGESFL